ncbi:TPA: hypothetical protein QCD44_003490 [Enterobacter hormaechei]|uniref:hypothetical protein n=1 Tax=Enterobacter hormaechei TaxID=158836 RepID=UPI00197DF48B|nr:hypothetical protein [Enterobacter hormaechei]ELD3469030.1 hypothetical protein [Enterobacter hormaechei]MBN4797514.1 hypothetical protein [Enterobacter hormaechei]MBN4821522.1 hypothetical protein [Enterobacter hormaechei]MED5729947.1 hypothetical protein [Enterobacter hormaechei]HBM2512603.1 hypothetical protein [Enterobacter hormaechei]
MTLIIASHDQERRILLCGDSLITGNQGNGTVKLLNLFRKIKNIPVNILRPNIDPSGKIISYNEMLQEHCCMIAFAGSTLVSQHIINNIEGHLKQLRFTYKANQYTLEMICDDNTSALNTLWADDMFCQTPSEVFNHLTKELQVKVIEHSIYKAIEDFINDEGKYDRAFFDTQFIIGLSCYKTKKNHIIEIKMDFTEGLPTLLIREIQPGETASIGISRYNEKIPQMFNDKSLSTADSMFKFLSESIDDNEEVDLREIGYPIILKRFDQFKELRNMQKHIYKSV